MLALFVVVQGNAQTVAFVPVLSPNTNIVNSVVTTYVQGTCNDGTNTYLIHTTWMQQGNPNYSLQYPHNYSPAAGLTGFPSVHLGDPDYYQGYVYVPMEVTYNAPQGSVNVDIAIFTAPNLVRCAAISISNYQSEASAVCIDPALSNSVALFVSNWASAYATSDIYEYSLNNLTNITFVKALPLSRHIPTIQGIICVGGMLYVMADSGPAGNVYQVNPTNGVVVYLAQLNIANETEWEGLDYFQGFLVAAEANTGTVNSYDFFGALAARSMHRITGWVKDNHNIPIAGVGLIATATINGTNQIATVDTDTNGSYSLIVSNGNWNVAVNCSSGSDSLGYLGDYSCPNSQNVSLTTSDVTNNFTVQNCAPFIVTPSTLPADEAGIFYKQTLQAEGCNPGFTWTVAGGSLPAGLSLSSGGTLSGTPVNPGGVFNVVVQVTDAGNSIASQLISIGITNAVQITTTSLPDSTFCNMTLNATNGQPPYVWSLSPGSAPLPPNLSLKSNGMLSGVSATNGTFNFNVRVKDSLGGVDDQPLSINLFQPLAISTTRGKSILLWPASATNCVLQTTTNLVSPDWETVTGAVPAIPYTITNTAPQQYFRLH
jgi:hypothetical protein